MKLIITTLIILLSTFLSAQDVYQKGTFHLSNGDTINAYIRVTTHNVLCSNTFFRYKNQTNSRIKIKASSIEEIEFETITYRKLQTTRLKQSQTGPKKRYTSTTTEFFAAVVETDGPPLYLHYRADPVFSYNSYLDGSKIAFPCYLSPVKKGYIRLTDLYYSKDRDTSFKEAPYFFDKTLNTFVYPKAHPIE